MKQILLCLILSLTSFFLLIADEADPFTSSLTQTQSLLPTTIQSVSAISGEWLESEIDFVVKGPNPLVLNRSYSLGYSSERLGTGWDFNRPHSLILKKYHAISKGKAYLKARLQHSSGVNTVHEAKDSKHDVISLPLSCTRALTNCRSGEMSAKTNLHNTLLKVDRHHKECEVITGSGHVMHYSLEREDLTETQYYSPDYERLPTGNLLRFKENKIVLVNADESLHYGKIHLSSEKNIKHITFEASGEQSATYTFDCWQGKKHKKRHRLTHVKYKHKPQVAYEYDDQFDGDESDPPLALLKKKTQGSLFQEVTYYQEGNNAVDRLSEVRIAKDDFRMHRVKEIKSPVGFDATPIITHRFIYLADHPSRGKSFSGKTEVYDVEMNKTIYAYNKEHRPTSIARYLKNGILYSKEKFIWDEGEENSLVPQFRESIQPKKEETLITASLLPSIPQNHLKQFVPHHEIARALLKPQNKDSSQVGNLLGKFLEDASGNILHARFFTYDSQGNILVDKFYGNLTGKCHAPVQLDRHHKPQGNGVQCYTKEMTYSDDAFHHLLSEKEDNGKAIEYEYDSDTQQVFAKYIKDGDQIHLRQFFFYDRKTAALTKVIKDDGSTRDPKNLLDVQTRHITYITINDSYPFGLPKVIEEKYWEGSQEVLLKRVDYDYNAKGNVASQKHFDAKGMPRYTLLWEYDDHGNIIKEVNALDHKITREYDDSDLLKIEIGPRLGDKVEYVYDNAHRLIEEKRHSDGKSFVTQHTYDLRGNRVSTTDSFGQIITYEYDEFGRLSRTSYPSILVAEDLLSAPTTENTYDVEGHPILLKDMDGSTTSLTYNARGKPISKTHPDGTIEQFEYHLDGTLAKWVSPNGTYTTYKRDFLGRVCKEKIYDANHQLISSQTFTYKGTKLVTKTDPECCTTTYAYDGAGRVVSEARGNARTTYTYDSLGRLSKEIKWISSQDASVHAFEHDLLGQVTEQRLEDLSGNVLQKCAYIYDALGNKTSTKIFNQTGESVTQIQVLADGKPICIIDAEGKITHFTYDYAHVNAIGQWVLKVTKTDPQGRNTISIFDAHSRLREVINQDPFGLLLAKQEVFYDTKGRQIKTIDSVIANGLLQRHSINAWRYHPSGQEEMIVEAAGTPEQKITTMSYNAFSQKEKVIKPDGVQLYYTYDALGRVCTLSSSDGSIDYLYAYNLRHQVKEVLDRKNHTTTTRHYNVIGEMEQEILGNGLSLSFKYDPLGRLAQLTLPDQSSVAYLYNAAYLKEIQRHEKGVIRYCHQNLQHDLSGNLLHAQLVGRAGQLHTSYDKLGRVQNVTSLYGSQTVGYDTLNRISGISTQDKAGPIDQAFTYDWLDHLQTESGHVACSYQSDSLHNRLHKNGVPCQLNVLNQLQEHAGCTYAYDSNGNLREKRQRNQNHFYTYDALNRLISVSSPTGLTTYAYDPFHRRISKTHQGQTERYLYQGQDEIGSVNDQGEISQLRILGIGIGAEMGAAVALELHGKVYIPIHDVQGSVASLIDEAGGVAEMYRYSAFGEESILNTQGEKVEKSEIGNPWRYASKRIDPETGWGYFGRRYYDAETGRWTTPDPLGLSDGPNLYAYLHHNPLNAYDAYGLIGEAYKDSCEAGMNVDRYSVFSDLDRTELGEDSRYQNSPLEYAIGFAKGFEHGMSNPLKVGYSNSGVGMFVNYMTNTQQSNFIGAENTQSLIMQICDKTGELGGSWVVLSSLGRGVKWMAEFGYSRVSAYLASRRAPVIIVEGLIKEESKIVAIDRITNTVSEQLIKGEINCVAREGIHVGKQIWSSTKNRTAVQNAFKHWKDHKDEFPELLNAKQYVEGTRTLFQNAEGALTKTRPNGEVLRYHLESNTFGAYTKDGIPKTMFRPREGIKYWELSN